jgi:hypothetical protein
LPIFDSHALTLNLAADPINTPSALLNRRRIPTQVMVNDVTAFAVQVDAFLPNGSGNQDFWAVRRVESKEIAVAVLSVAFYKLDDVPVLSPGVVSPQGQRALWVMLAVWVVLRQGW